MGYTHYWKHSARFTKDEWATIQADVSAVLAAAAATGVALGDTMGDAKSDPIAAAVNDPHTIGFNGLADESLETFLIYKDRRPLEDWQEKSRHGCDFCKTGREPYDVAVTACLVYLDSYFPKKFSADSDGGVADWEAGLALAKAALPRLANVLSIPGAIVFDSQFKDTIISGNRLFIAQTVADEIVIGDGVRRVILARFPAAITPDIASRVLAMKARDPARNGWVPVSVAARWADRQCRTLLQSAPMLGGAVA